MEGSDNNSPLAEEKAESSDNIFKKSIAEQVSALSGIPVEQIIECVEESKKTAVADFAIPIPKLNRFKKLEGRPNEICKTWSEQFKTNDLITSVVAEGTYLNFKVNKIVLVTQLLKNVVEQKDKYGSQNQGANQTVIVEFSSPNIAKPFHAGHLRSTIIGNFLKNIYKFLGYKVIAINYLGDWGKQYGLLAIGFQKYGSQAELEKNPIQHLFDVYVKINQDKEKDPTIDDAARAYFKKMEEGDIECLDLWKKFRELSIVEYKRMYARLNVEFDDYSGESFFGSEMIQELQKLDDLKLLTEDKGATIANLEDQKLGKVIVKKKDGSSLYITRDIAAAHYRLEKYHFDKMIYVVAAQQNLHFQQLFALLEKMGYSWTKDCVHINFGMVKGMSTRKGNVVFLSEILDEAKTTMLEVMKQNEKKFSEINEPEAVADIIGLSAVVIQDLAARRIKDYPFDWARMTSFEGDTGPYLQFAHARLCSMERKASEQDITVNPNANLSLLVEKEAFEICAQIGRFPSVLQSALTQMEPCTIVNYLFALCHSISAALEKIRVVGREKNIAEARLLVYWAARITLGNGLKILGLKPLERM